MQSDQDVKPTDVDVLRRLILEMGVVAERGLRYSRTASFLLTLEIVLHISAVVATVVSVVYPHPQLVVTCVALWVATLVATILHDRYRIAILKEFDKLAKLARFVALSVKIDELLAKLEREVDELEQELKKRKIIN